MTRKPSDKAVASGSLFLLAAAPLALMFQGIDLTDTGWVLSNYQNFFAAPESVSYWFHLWFTNFAGGLWNEAFGGGGLLSFRFGAVLVFWLTAYFTYRSYRGLVADTIIFPALLMGMVLHFPGKITVIHYNNVSTLVLVLGAFFILEWAAKGNPARLAVSGAWFALAVFARFPNLLAVLFASVVVLAGRRAEKTPKAVLRDLVVFFGGFLLAVFLVLAAMKALGHLDLYLESVRDLFSGSKEDLSHYGSDTIEKKFFVDHGRALLASTVGMICLGAFRAALGRSGRRRAVVAGYFFLTAFAAAAGWLYLWDEAMPVIYFFVGLTYLTGIAVYFHPGSAYAPMRFPALASVLIVMILSVGSDTGMKVGSYGLIFGLPLLWRFWLGGEDLAATVRFDGPAPAESRLVLSRERRVGIFSLAILCFAAFVVPYLYRGTYRDASLRHRMTTPTDSPLLRGVFTTPGRAAALDEALRALDAYVKPGDRLLCFESVPLVHFLTRTRPFLHNPWPILYLPSELERNLKAAMSEEGPLPPAILARNQARSGKWPRSGRVSGDETARRDRAILRRFFNEKGYRKVWESEAFVILLPAR